MTANSTKEWLDIVYDSRKKRTVEITQKSIDLLLKQNDKVSLNSIVKISRQIDPKGISHSAILNNKEAREIYETHRSWLKRNKIKKNKQFNLDQVNLYNLSIQINNDLDSYIRRHSRLTKIQLIERLAIVEKAYALLQKKWLEEQSSRLEDQ